MYIHIKNILVCVFVCTGDVYVYTYNTTMFARVYVNVMFSTIWTMGSSGQINKIKVR